jgi:hypothetical protein
MANAITAIIRASCAKSKNMENSGSSARGNLNKKKNEKKFKIVKKMSSFYSIFIY